MDMRRVLHEDLHTDVWPQLPRISRCLVVHPADDEAAPSLEPGPRMVNHMRERHTVRLDTASLVIEPEVGCAGETINNEGMGENNSNSTIVGDLLGACSVRAERNQHEK